RDPFAAALVPTKSSTSMSHASRRATPFPSVPNRCGGCRAVETGAMPPPCRTDAVSREANFSAHGLQPDLPDACRDAHLQPRTGVVRRGVRVARTLVASVGVDAAEAGVDPHHRRY